MAARQTLTRPGLGAGSPADGAGVRLSGLVHAEFRERTTPVFAMDPAMARDMARVYGLTEAQFQRLRGATGTTFVTMIEALLARAGEPPADLDAVLLAYQSPDLYRAEVAGCYLSDRLPGAPVPFSVAEQGPAAVFTALCIADGMCRLGELDHGALFCFDQNATRGVGPSAGIPEPAADRPDSAVLIGLGGRGDAEVAALHEIRTGEPGDPTPAQALDSIMVPGVRTLIGQALRAQLPSVPDGVEVAAHWCTGVWAALAADWPIRQPVLVGESQPVAGRVHGCLLVPETR